MHNSDEQERTHTTVQHTQYSLLSLNGALSNKQHQYQQLIEPLLIFS